MADISLLRKLVTDDIERDGAMSTTMVRAGLLNDILDELEKQREALQVLSNHFEHGWGDDTRHGVISDVERIAKQALADA